MTRSRLSGNPAQRRNRLLLDLAESEVWGSRSFRRPPPRRCVAVAFDEFAVVELRAGSDERDQVRADGAPA